MMVSPAGLTDKKGGELVKKGRIGFACSGISKDGAVDPFFWKILSGVHRVSRGANLASPVYYDAGDIDRFEHMFDFFQEDEITGLVVSGGVSYEILCKICKEVNHVVLITPWEVADVPTVVLPYGQAAYDMMQHLMRNLGHSRIAFIGRSMDVPYVWPDELKYIKRDGVILHVDGYKKALKEAGIKIDERLIKNTLSDIDHLDDAFWMVKELMQLPDRPTAIMCQNDNVAARVIRSLRGMGLSVPNDVAVVGFDNSDFGLCIEPKLTTVTVPQLQIGELAASILVRQFEGKEIPDKRIVVPLNLVVRESCGAAKKIDDGQF